MGLVTYRTKIHTYSCDWCCNERDFMVDIVERKDAFEAWLYHKDFGIKMMMFGSEYSSCNTISKFKKLVEANVDLYTKEYYREVNE